MLGLGLWLRMGSAYGSVPTEDIFIDSNIVIVFSEAVDPLTVTNVGNGTGSFELYNDTQDAWVAGVLSTSDNIEWTFNPTANFTYQDRLTLHLTSAIESAVGAVPYDGPFEYKYRVVNRLPVMTAFTIDATSNDANIGILTLTATDADNDAIHFGISLTNDYTTVETWQTNAAWIAAGFDTGLPEGTNETVTLYAFCVDINLGYQPVGLSDTCDVDIPDTTAPTMVAFTCAPTSVSATIDILTLSATDNVGVAAYQINESATEPNPATGTWQSAALWIANGYESSVVEGFPETVTLYAWAKDAADNVSTSLTDSCDVTVTHTPTFSVQPTLNTALYDGGSFDMTVTDVNGGHLVDIDAWNGSTWVNKLSNVAIGAKTITVDGLAAGAIDYIKFRVYDNGTTDYQESNLVASFNTAKPVIDSVTPGNQQNTITFSDAAGDTADSFNLKWGTSSGSLTNTITGVTSPYDHTGLTNDQPYYYAIVAVEGGLNSTQSDEASGTPAEATAVVFNSADKGSAVTLSTGDTRASSSVASWSNSSVRANVSASSGLRYCEFKVLIAAQGGGFGVANASAPLTNYIGSDANGWMFAFDGNLYYNGSPFATGITWGVDTYGVLWDATNGDLYIKKGGAPDTGVDTPVRTGVTGTLFPAAAIFTNAGDALEIVGDRADWADTPEVGALGFGE